MSKKILCPISKSKNFKKIYSIKNFPILTEEVVQTTESLLEFIKEQPKKTKAHELFENNLVSDYLITNFIPTYINLSKNELLQKQFKIKGVPTIIICNQDLQEIKRFGSELVDFTPAQFLEALRKYEKI